mmetsp:Transcript_8139/g.16005  ORF Transcript_8139/g.16005 Transcript_8139/m.16005 type:complete len:184 (-) Transcript_8139:99-650(-)
MTTTTTIKKHVTCQETATTKALLQNDATTEETHSPNAISRSSPGVVRFLREEKALAVRGNHDDSVLMHAFSSKATPNKYRYIEQLSPTDLEWYSRMPLSLRFPDLKPPILVVHAGVVPGKKLEEQEFDDFIRMRQLRAKKSPSSSSSSSSSQQRLSSRHEVRVIPVMRRRFEQRQRAKDGERK